MRQRKRQRERQRKRERDRETEREIERHLAEEAKNVMAHLNCAPKRIAAKIPHCMNEVSSLVRGDIATNQQQEQSRTEQRETERRDRAERECIAV